MPERKEGMNKTETRYLIITLGILLLGMLILGVLAIRPVLGASSDNITQFNNGWDLHVYMTKAPSYFSGYSLEKHNCAFIAGDLYQQAQTDNVGIKIIWDAQRLHWDNIGVIKPMRVWYLEPYTAYVRNEITLPAWIMERWQRQNDFMGVIWRHGEGWELWSIFQETTNGFVEIDKYGNINPALGYFDYRFEWRTQPGWWK